MDAAGDSAEEEGCSAGEDLAAAPTTRDRSWERKRSAWPRTRSMTRFPRNSWIDQYNSVTYL